MMKKYLLSLLFCFLIANQVHAQIVVSGLVIDAKSEEALQGVNVYINTTSISTVTDSLGKFKLVVPRSGKIELIISHLVYQKKVLVVLAEKSEHLVVEMNFKNNVLNQVVIQGKKPSKSSIINWTELFAANLIGNYPDVGVHCKIKNPEVLYFNYDKLNNQLQVFARRPILIENAALGYLITLELDEFMYNFKREDVVFKYSLFFEDMVIPKIKRVQVIKKRKLLYVGSNMHFMRALYNNTTEAEGFSIFKYSSIKNTERLRVERIVRERIEYTYANQIKPKIDMARLFSISDTIKYYSNVMQLSPVVSFDTVKLASSAVRTPQKTQTLVNFNSSDTLMIRYRGVDPSKASAADVFSTRFVGNSKQHKKEEKPPKFTLDWNSYLFFFNKDGVNMEENGYYPEMGLFVYGDMGERRLAGILPFDYNPNEEL